MGNIKEKLYSFTLKVDVEKISTIREGLYKATIKGLEDIDAEGISNLPDKAVGYALLEYASRIFSEVKKREKPNDN